MMLQIKSEILVMEALWNNLAGAALMVLSSAIVTHYLVRVKNDPEPHVMPDTLGSESSPLNFSFDAGCMGVHVQSNQAVIIVFDNHNETIDDDGALTSVIDSVSMSQRITKGFYSGQANLSPAFKLLNEVDCLLRGVHFGASLFAEDLYSYRIRPDRPVTEAEPLPTSVTQWYKDVKNDTETFTCPSSSVAAPFLLVVLDSDVKIFKAQPESSTGNLSYDCLTTSPIGGDTFFSLCRLCNSRNTGGRMECCTTMREALHLAERGNCSGVDMSVQDIYGGDYGSLLVGAMTAASLGKLRDGNTPVEDVAMALLMAVTLNVGQLTVLSAQMAQMSPAGCTVYITGTWLSELVERRLAWSIGVWSGGGMVPRFIGGKLKDQSKLKALGAWATAAAVAGATVSATR